MVSADSAGTACPLSDRNSTYHPVQFPDQLCPPDDLLSSKTERNSKAVTENVEPPRIPAMAAAAAKNIAKRSASYAHANPRLNNETNAIIVSSRTLASNPCFPFCPRRTIPSNNRVILATEQKLEQRRQERHGRPSNENGPARGRSGRVRLRICCAIADAGCRSSCRTRSPARTSRPWLR